MIVIFTKLKNKLVFYKYTICTSLLQSLMNLRCLDTVVWRRQKFYEKAQSPDFVKFAIFSDLLTKLENILTLHNYTICTSLLQTFMDLLCIVTEI